MRRMYTLLDSSSDPNCFLRLNAEFGPGPLFQFQDGSSLHPLQLVLAIHNALANQNFDVSQYCGHSFHIGTATTAAAAHIMGSRIA